MTRVTRLLRELIAIPSVNPAFRPTGDAFSGEARVAEFLAARARKAGLDVEFQEVFPNRSNVIVRLRPRGEVKRRVMLAPHMDTVGGDVDGGRLFEPVAKRERLHGRGACDTKGSVAAMFDSLVRVAIKGKRPANTELIFLGLVDEEHEQMGSRYFAEHGFKADLAIVGEPTKLRVVTAHKGDFWLRLQTRGRSAHGSQPHRGRNAVHAMAKLVDVLETEYAELLRKTRHPLLGCGTVNVGTIQGGAQANVVPNECSITIDRRTLPGETEASIRRELKSLLKQRGITANIFNHKKTECLPLNTDPELPLVRQFMGIARQRNPIGVDYFCDGSPLSQGGTPSIVFGPGDIAQAHTADEWIALDSLNAAPEMLETFLRAQP